jgi:hypothetical protein
MKLKRAVAYLIVGTTLALGPLAMQPASAAKPCNGCVGNADGKAPKGQSDGDKNAGYECDRNNGVGQGNPAHSDVCETPNG